ncbi:MAG TPA: cytochrome c biogenesis protein CcsA [Pyrinomonadaceae bacterium]|nr:cytochrome c biogenesis protein CcsA [Pyrinomonadaceae bacterium]
MNNVIKQSGALISPIELNMSERLKEFFPVAAPIILAVIFIAIRLFFGQQAFLYESALTVLALMSFLTGSAFLITNLFVKANYLNYAGLISVALGYSFNLSGWMIRWIEAGEKEGWIKGRIWRYFPLDNLYSLTLGFCAGAALATLFIIRNQKYRILGVISMPIISVIMLQAFFFGGEIRTLPPILNSYWLPMHVTTATFGYGAALVSFGIALAYLIKDRIRIEAFAIVVSLLGLLILSVACEGSVLFHAEYGPSVMFENQALPLHSVLPTVGIVMLMEILILLATLVLFIAGWDKTKPNLNIWGWRIFYLSIVIMGISIGLIFYQISQTTNPSVLATTRDYSGFGAFLAKQTQTNIPLTQQAAVAQNWISQNGSRLNLSYRSNPVEFAALIALFVSLLMTALIGLKREAVAEALPSLEMLDGLLYRTVGVVVPLLTLLLITGAVWANESWGRYWGWDPKEVSALVSWIAFSGYLHLRLVGGWKGRRSVYVVLLGFILVIFTWLGVSFLLPGLHSYA